MKPLKSEADSIKESALYNIELIKSVLVDDKTKEIANAWKEKLSRITDDEFWLKNRKFFKRIDNKDIADAIINIKTVLNENKRKDFD